MIINPKWEFDYKISLLTLKTLELQLQEEWNNAKAQHNLPISGRGRSPDGSQPVQPDASAAIGGESGRQSVRSGTEY
jgi:hypothetical protein